MNKKIITTILAVIIVILIIISVGGKKDDGVIKIGFIGPLTGGAASYGDLYKAGVQFAYSDLLKDGERDGKKFQVIYEDGGCDSKTAVSAAQKLMNVDKVDAIIGGMCSGETMAMIDLVNQNKIPVITAGSNPEIATKSNYVFQIWPVDSYGGKVMADMVKKYSPKTVAVLSANTTYALGISDVFIKEFGNVAMYEKFTEDQTDFKSVVAKVRDIKADALIINTQTPGTLLVLAKQLRESGIETQIYTAYHNSEDVLKSPHLAGMRTVVVPVLESDSKDLVKRFKEKTGTEASMPFIIAGGYDSLDLFINAFSENGKNSDKIVKYLEGIKDYKGLTGKFNFVNHQVNGLNLPIMELVNKKLVDIK
jgi:branched-chain amino acid transport system substrate-binding protein